MNGNIFLNQIEQIGVGLAFIIYPMLFIFAFAVHPGLLKPRLLDPKGLILRPDGNCIRPVWDTNHRNSTVTILCNRWKVRDSSHGYHTNKEAMGGIPGIISTAFPALTELGIAFGLGIIVWWIWLGIVMLVSRPSWVVEKPTEVESSHTALIFAGR